jgi:diphosphomevalonate decarboxylase
MQATAVAHPNVALIKYWGKSSLAQNQPAVGSLSLTLAGLETRTSIRFDSAIDNDQIKINGAVDASAQAKVTRCLDVLRERAGIDLAAHIESTNNFPTAAGLASSASGYAALVKAADGALGLGLAAAELADIARLGSGSAARSIYPGIVALRPDQQAQTIGCETISGIEDWPLVTVVAITSQSSKPIGSTDGMERSRATSPYYQGWLDTHPADLDVALDCVATHDFARLADVSEQSCLKMHAVAMSTNPPLVYWSGVTVDLMQAVRQLRADSVPVFFTIDAGPQLKAVCLPEATDTVKQALELVPGVLEIMVAPLGAGARLV